MTQISVSPLVCKAGRSQALAAGMASFLVGGTPYSLPGATVAAGDRLQIECLVEKVGTTAGAIFNIVFGGTALLGGIGDAAASLGSVVVADVIVLGATTQKAWAQVKRGDVAYSGVVLTAPAETISGAINIDFQASGNAADSLILRNITIRLFKATP